jgi:hypothetical protein
MTDDTIEYKFMVGGTEDGWIANHANDPKLALLACCVASQQTAGFRNVIDLREALCPECKASGFNTGWGVFRYSCGGETHNDDEGTWAEPCGAETYLKDLAPEPAESVNSKIRES